MKKLLIKSSRVDEFIVSPENKIYVDSTMILTSGAKEILQKKGVPIVYGQKPVKAKKLVSCSDDGGQLNGVNMEALVKRVAEFLKNDYQMTDPRMIRDVSLKIIDKINSNRE